MTTTPEEHWHATFTPAENALLEQAGKSLCPQCGMNCNCIELHDNPGGICTACSARLTRQARRWHLLQQ